MPFPSWPTTLTKPKLRSWKAKKAYAAPQDRHITQRSANFSYRYAHNAESSPLLRLPGELRNRIYKDVLGRKTVQIFRSAFMDIPGWGCAMCFQIYVCTNHMPDDSEQPYEHEFCRLFPPVTYLYLGFMRCCSQVYSEAALIPFIHNTFSFNDAASLS